MKKAFKSLLVSFVINLAFVGRAFAATAEFCSASSKTFLGFPTWYKYLDYSFDPVKKSCELNNVVFPDDLAKVGLAVIEILLRLGGLIAVAFVVYGGFRYITSQGEPDKTKEARQTIINSLVGVAISITATAIVAFIGKEFVK